jgi:hypothetical protein
MNNNDPYHIEGKYMNGKLQYEYPAWMTMMVMGGLNQSVKPVLGVYEIYNPNNIELIEGVMYEAQLIVFDDGEVAEILKPKI